MATRFRGIPQKMPAHMQVAQQLQATLQQALALHQAGRFAEAKRLYEQILKVQPKHFDCLHLLGVIAIQSGRTEHGVQLIDKAIAIDPNVASAHNNRGNALKGLRRLDQALASYDQALALQPDDADAYNNRGDVLLDLKRLDEALASYEQALALKPDDANAHNSRGNALLHLNRLDEALASYNQALTLKPGNANLYGNRGNALLDLKRLDEALASYDMALTLNPDSADACVNRGNALLELKRPDEALASYNQALMLSPDDDDAHNNRGNALRELKRLDEALASYNHALTLRPDNANVHNNRGNALKDLERLDEALASYGQALALKPDFANAHHNCGNTLKGLGRLDEALESYDMALALSPDDADAHNNRGNALNDLKRGDEALASYDMALALKPGHAEAHNNRGNALNELKRCDEALASCDKALALKPDYDYAHNNRGNALRDLKRLDEALVSYGKALMLSPDYAEAYGNRGNALHDLKRIDEALADYARALRLKPGHEFLFGTYLHTKMTICDWDLFDENMEKYTSDLSQAKKVTTPFPALSLLDMPDLHKISAKIFNESKYPRNRAYPSFARPAGNHKIRIGYYSADFHNHATAYLMAELLEAHDSEKFEIYGFSFGPGEQDSMRERLHSAFDEFFDVRGKSDKQVAQLSRDLGMDMAIDLKGYTQDSRTGIFAEGCAPIQVNYLGYPGTMGADYIDYIIADKILIPVESQSHYTEKVVYLPHSYQVNDSTRKISDRIFTKQELGLPETGFIFCCFNNNNKILPETFSIWMRLLKAVEGSVLWLFQDNPGAAANLRKEAKARGVDSTRLIFGNFMPVDEHLARHKLADLFLDTLPCNAHTTTSDALWAGVPVLTCMGKSFASRVAASLLNAIDLPELVTITREEYEALAIELATNPVKLLEIKKKLEKNRMSTPLFDGKLFAKHLESAYETMYARYRAGLEPAPIAQHCIT